MNEIAKLSLDIYKGVATNFEGKDANEVLRLALKEATGMNQEEMDFYAYQENKLKIFRVLSETITPVLNEKLAQTIGQFAEIKNLAFGDTTVFDIENHELFEVANVADGTGNLYKQRIDNGKLPITMGTFGVAIYDEFYRFLAGRVDWTKVVNKVVKSFENKIAKEISNALFGAYNNLDSSLKYTGSFVEDSVLAVVREVEARYGSAMIVGTKAAVSKIKPEYVGEADKAQHNQLGYLATFQGYDVIALAQGKEVDGTYSLPVGDLLVLPASGEKPVKVVMEGTAIVLDHQNTQGDLSIEHTFIQKAGVAVPIANQYGIIKLS